MALSTASGAGALIAGGFAGESARVAMVLTRLVPNVDLGKAAGKLSRHGPTRQVDIVTHTRKVTVPDGLASDAVAFVGKTGTAGRKLLGSLAKRPQRLLLQAGSKLRGWSQVQRRVARAWVDNNDVSTADVGRTLRYMDQLETRRQKQAVADKLAESPADVLKSTRGFDRSGYASLVASVTSQNRFSKWELHDFAYIAEDEAVLTPRDRVTPPDRRRGRCTRSRCRSGWNQRRPPTRSLGPGTAGRCRRRSRMLAFPSHR